MAKRKLVAQLNPVNCKVVDSLELVTKPNLAMTPKQVQELTERGIVTGKQIGRASCRERVSSPV